MTHIEKLNKILDYIPEEKKDAAADLIAELAFMYETLETLKGDIRKHGCVVLFKNGKQEFLKDSPAVKSYTNLIGKYSALYKQVVSMMIVEDRKVLNEFESFVME